MTDQTANQKWCG